jgi:hypothetical protein
VLCIVGLGACSGAGKPEGDAGVAVAPLLSREELMKPETCMGCHPKHYREWASSMHAYAGIDPVFLAMNRRGQRETDGALGDFCVRCHAPMAVREGATMNGLNLDDVPRELKGVTCYFCHAAVSHEALSNNGLVLKEDGVMRGPIANAVDPGVHGVSGSAYHDPKRSESSALCGSCHDVVTPAGVHVERTYEEYSQSLFAREGLGFASCQTCHMEAAPEQQEIADMPGMTLPKRKRHSHLWPAVDIALTDDFPDQDVQYDAVMCELVNSLGVSQLQALNPLGLEFLVTLETNAGHAQPSGAAQDRRMWIQTKAYDAQGNVISESGAIEDDEVEEPSAGSPGHDRFLTMLRDRLYDADAQEVHLFWQAEPSPTYPDGHSGRYLLAQDAAKHVLEANYTNPGPVDRFEVEVKMRPVGMDILRSLVETGDLDESVLARMRTFTLGSATWRAGGPPKVDFARPVVRCQAGGF